MIKLKNTLLCFHFALTFVSVSHAQSYQNPVTIPPALSGNFGELRNNHFHSGIDFKTQQVINKPIVSIADGYVSRISVSPGGYGLALYIDHPATGHTSVYGHLNNFSKKIADYVKSKQYEQESFRVNLELKAHEIPVKKGEQVGLSGNTGSSGGPHLHFEIRDARTQDPLDVLEFLNKIPDTQKPELRGIAFYPMEGRGVVNGSPNPLRMDVRKDKSGNPLPLARTINAWGRIGLGVKAYDRMNGQNNIYGVRTVRLFVDDEQVFSSVMNRFSFDKTRMLNSFVDFEDWRLRRSFFQKSFIEPGNTLPVYKNMKNNGYIDILEERAYHVRYELEDYYGNKLSYSFTINGQRQDIPTKPACNHYMAWGLTNSFMDFGFMLTIPSGNLYSDFCYTHAITKNRAYFSDIHRVNNMPVPLHNNATMWIKLTADTLQNRMNYGVVRINRNGGESWIGGAYKNGGVETAIRELGDSYAIAMDSIAPKIVPMDAANWIKQKRIRIRLSDDKSGIESFRGEINGKFILFTHDTKSNVYTYVFDDERLTKGKKQTLVFTATDSAGNKAEYLYEFDY